MNTNTDAADWLKQDLEDASREVESRPLWMKQANANYRRPLELSQYAMRLKELSKQAREAAESVGSK